MKKKRALLAGLLLLMILSGTAMAKDKNSVLFDAMSPYEDLTEYALNENKIEVNRTVDSLHGSIGKLKNVLSSGAIQTLEENIKEMQVAENKAAFPDIALLSVHSYRVIAGELDPSTLKVPIQVVLLDYVGFRIHALLKQKNIDWRLISETVDEGKKQWKEIKRQVSDRGLYDSVNTALEGLESSSRSKNIAMLRFASQVVLDLVDLLEGYFEKNK